MIMIISDAEAKTKWCPFSFSVPEQRDQFSGQGIREGGPWTCCTTFCMAWRPAETVGGKREADREFRTTGKRIVSDTGYCALMPGRTVDQVTSQHREGDQ